MNRENAFIITTSSGEGIGQLFLELGADALIPACDAPPSEEDFLHAIGFASAESILILPNGEGALASATRAATGLDFVRVLPTRSFSEGYAALAAMPRGESADVLYSFAAAAVSSLVSIEITCESRGTMNERYAASSGGERYSLSASAEAALFESVERLICPHHRIITLIVGRGVTNSRRVFVTERLGELYPDREIIVYIGGQTATEYYIALR